MQRSWIQGWAPVGRTCVADLVIVNARVHTVDAAEAGRGGRRSLRRSHRPRRNQRGDPRRQRCQDSGHRRGGRLLLPGFNDAHVHLISGADELVGVNLRPAVTRTGLRQAACRLRRYVSPRAAGSSADSGITRPGRAARSRFTTSSTAATRRQSGVRAASRRTHGARQRRSPCASPASRPIPPLADGGTIVRDRQGQPTGIFKDNAMDFITRAVPARYARADHGQGAARRYSTPPRSV